jgi:hypothetical protein
MASLRRTFLSRHSRRASFVQHFRPLEYLKSRNLDCSWIPRCARQSSTRCHLIFGVCLSLNSAKRSCRSIFAVSSPCREEGVCHYLTLLRFLGNSSSNSNSSNNSSSSSSNGNDPHLRSNSSSSSRRTTSFKTLGLICRRLAPCLGIWGPSKGNSIRLCLEARRMRLQVGCWPSQRRRSNSNSDSTNNRFILSSNIKHSSRISSVR